MIKHTKDILMYKVSKKAELYNEEEMKQIAELSETASKEELINIIYKLSELQAKMKASSQKTIIFETEIIKLCVKVDIDGLEGIINALERKIENGDIQISNTAKIPEAPKTITERPREKVNISPSPEEPKIEAKKEEKPKEIVKPVKLEPGEKIGSWQNVITKLKTQGKVMLYANLINTEAVEINDMTVAIRFQNGLNAFRKDLLQKPENLNILTKEIATICGKPMQIKFEDASGSKVQTKKAAIEEPKVSIPKEEPEDILESLDIPINFVEEE